MINMGGRIIHKGEDADDKDNINTRIFFDNFELSKIVNDFIHGKKAQGQENNKHFPVKTVPTFGTIKAIGPNENKAG